MFMCMYVPYDTSQISYVNHSASWLPEHVFFCFQLYYLYLISSHLTLLLHRIKENLASTRHDVFPLKFDFYE
jgi:hypothetical protein